MALTNSKTYSPCIFSSLVYLVLVSLGCTMLSSSGYAKQASQKEFMDADLFYKIEGKGKPPIVFLHGMLGSHRYWDGVVPKLEVNNELILIDLLGFGDSPKPNVDYSVEQHVSKIHDVIKRAKKDQLRLVVVGHSMGTFLALNFAAAHPEQVEKLILINAPMKTDEESLKKEIGEESSQLMVTMTFSKTWGKLVCKLHELIPSASYPLIRIVEPDLPPAVAKAAGQHNYNSYSGSFENILLKQNFYELLAKIPNIPVLVLASDRDEYTKEKALDRLPQRDTVKLVIINGNHNVLLKNPGRVADEILKFIE